MNRSTKGQTLLWRGVAVLAAVALAVAGCGAEEGGGASPAITGTTEFTETTEAGPPEPIEIPDVTEPVGEPLMPDLVPEPPVDLRIRYEDDGRTTIRFSSTLVNIGEGDFVLRATLTDDGWVVEQEIHYSDGGFELIPTEATMVWGGDGHNHWHIERVATYTLYRLDEDGEVVDDDIALPDNKVGFCFFDHTRALETAVEDRVFRSRGCGEEGHTAIRMGMSPGWSDIYSFRLPGQSIDVTDLADGTYRVIAEADPQGWFTEADLENNVTWLNFTLLTRGDDRFAGLAEIGPQHTEIDG